MIFPLTKLSSTGASLVDISSRMASLAAEANGINSSIAGCYGQGGVGGRAGAVSSKMYSQASTVSHLGQVSSDAAKSYMTAEDNIGTLVYSKSGEKYSRIPEKAATEVAEKPMSTWTKVWKTGAAVLSIAGAGVATVASWAVASSSAGFGAPGAILVSIYSANTIVNSGTDIINMWFGNQKNVGKVNFLKTSLSEGGGILTEMLCGNRDVGETIGKGVYSVGNFASAIVSARSLSLAHGGGSALTSHGDEIKNNLLGKSPEIQVDKYVQSDMFNVKYVSKFDPKTGKELSAIQKVLNASTGNSFIDTGVKAITEIPTAVKGYAEMIIHPRFGSWRYDTTMLGYQIKNLSKCKSFYDSTKGMYQLIKDTSEVIIPEGITNPSKFPLPDGML